MPADVVAVAALERLQVHLACRRLHGIQDIDADVDQRGDDRMKAPATMVEDNLGQP